ncbi:MAG: right-handed parallel beta-helix repeat-containing protein [Candidatus Zixiibacteriota bacterium]|nr:MAG: right-handed parallel beta-helix repeat-containing protein [candidate division Zixibacteria bacterium]
MGKIKYILLAFCMIFTAGQTYAVEFYVSPTGNNNNPGTSPDQAWASIEHGDTSGQVGPGDIVNILPGTYLPTQTITLDRSGTDSSYIIYRKLGPRSVIIDGQNLLDSVLVVNGEYLDIYGFELTNSLHDCLKANNRYGTVAYCYVHHTGGTGIVANQREQLLFRNRAAYNAGTGIYVTGFCDEAEVYNNTVFGNGGAGIEFHSSVSTGRVFNNIVAHNLGGGIIGDEDIICGFNNACGNVGGNLLFVTDSAGGFSVEPGFADTTSGKFALRHTAAELDAGLAFDDYPFNGAAPDMGASEKYNVYYVSPIGADTAEGRTLATSWKSIDNGNSCIFPGDTVYVQPGMYSDSVVITDSGLPDDTIWYIGVGDGCSVDGSGYNTGVQISASYLVWIGIDINGSFSSNISMAGIGLRLSGCEISNAPVGLFINGRENVITNNVFRNSEYAGIFSWTTTDDLYANNTFYNNGRRDIYQPIFYDINVFNNIFVAHGAGDTAIDGSVGSVISHCLFYGYEEICGKEGEPGEGCLIGLDPVFLNPDSGDFHLDRTSPAIDAGYDLGFPFHGYAPDMGAIETAQPDSMEIVSCCDTLVADSTYLFEALAWDADGFPTRPGATMWSHTFVSGSISSGGVFTPALVGQGTVTAEDAIYGLSAESAPLTVVPGTLDRMTVEPQRVNLSVDSTQQFLLYGWDIRDNSVDVFGDVTWAAFGNIGTISQAGLFTATDPGYGFVRATSSLGPTCISDTITVTAGDPKIYVSSLTMPIREIIPGTNTGAILALEFVNDGPTGVPLDSVRLEFTGDDPFGATREELDSQIEGVALYLEKDNQYTDLTDLDSLLCTGTLSDGYAVLPTSGLLIPPGGANIKLTVAALLDALNARDGNDISFQIAGLSDIYLGEEIAVVADFPLDNDAQYIVNTFPSDLAQINPVEGSTLFQGQTERLVLDFNLPPNGYAEDFLSSVKVVNAGTFDDNGETLEIRLWADQSGDGFTADDAELGSFTYSSGFWQISGLSYALAPYGQRFFVTVDIKSSELEGGIVDLVIPVKSVEYASGADGPDDTVLRNPMPFVVMPIDRVTAVSVPSPSSYVSAGSADRTILTFGLYNGYSEAKTLQTVRLANHTRTASSSAFADAELGQVSLHLDVNHNRIFDGDPAIASGYFSGGLLSLSPAGLSLAAESLCYFFVVVALPHEQVIDSDSLSVTIDQESDIVFDVVGGESVNINGDMPLTSGTYLILDGSVRSQYQVIEQVSSSVTPGDTSITLLCLTPAVNGDQFDTLTSLMVSNAGTADDSDFDVLELWLDLNGDQQWQSGDSLVKQFSYTGSDWLTGSLSLETSPAPVCLFVTGDVSGAATPGATFQPQIPVDGCQFISGNDGPFDAALMSQADIVVSASGLRISAMPLSESYSIGQQITVPAQVTNLLGTPLDTVYCEFVAVNNGVDSIVLGPVYLGSEETTQFDGLFTASGSGSESWRIRAFSENPIDSSVAVYTDEVRIDEVPSDVALSLVNSAPTAVSRGQANVFPLSIRFEQVDTSSTRTAVRLDSIQISVEDDSGQPLAANSVFSRMVVATDNINLVVENSPPSTPSVWLRFTEPVVVPAAEDQLLSLLVDIDSFATASNFVLALSSPGDVNIVDDNTSQTVAFDPGVVFPMMTVSCRIDDPSQQLAVSGQSTMNTCVNYGQEGVDALELSIRHPGNIGTSQIQVTSLSLEIIDDALNAVDPSDVVEAVRVLKRQMIIGELATIIPGSTSLTVDFAAPPTISPSETELLNLQIDLKLQSPYSTFAVRIEDSTAFTVRDLSSGSVVLAVSDQELATGNVFPLISGYAGFKNPAVSPEICLSSAVPEYIIGGAAAVELLEMTAIYEAAADYSSIRVSDVVARIYNSAGALVNPNDLFDQIGISVEGGPVTYDPFIELQDGFAVFHLGNNGVVVNPGDTTSIMLVGDIENATPVEDFLLTLQSEGALTLCDATDTASHPAILVSPTCPFSFPFETELSQVYLQAGRPVVSIDTPPTQLAFPGQNGLPLLQIDLSYDSPTPQGDLLMNAIAATVR